jgi:hypothetical protein
MRDHLVGYLLNALEPDEQELVEQQLAADPQLRRDLELLHRSLDPLRADRGFFQAPVGLCDRTCRFVVERMTTVRAPEARAARWTFSDVTIMAGIMLIASSLFFPALHHSRQSARLAGCQNNLRQVGTSLARYSEGHNGYFPEISPGSNLGAAGIYAVRLAEDGALPDPRLVVCPSSQLAEQRNFRLPTTIELKNAKGETLVTFHRTMGGSYGYTLGHLAGDEYRPTKNRQRKNFAVVADAPLLTADGPRSFNHGGKGQNVLFEDGHAEFLTECEIAGCRDKIYLNDQDQPAAGLHENDSVIAGSAARPFLTTVKLKK